MTKSEVMTRAWEIIKNGNNGSYSKLNFSICLKKAWAEYKTLNTKTEELKSIRLDIETVENGFLLKIKEDFNFTLKQIKEMTGREWKAELKAWFIPESSKSDLIWFTTRY